MRYYPNLLWNGQCWVSAEIDYRELINEYEVVKPKFNIGELVSCYDNIKGVVLTIQLFGKQAHSIDEVYNNNRIQYEVLVNGAKFILKEPQLS
jgi:hypothetical protein